MSKVIIAVMMVFLWVAVAFAAVDINAAGVQELESLPGIGPAKAEAIVKYREEKGPFATVDDLVKVKGIGEKSLEVLRGHIEVKK